ncbi:MAG: methyltransferase [Gemmatimonadetes bacterium]|nr:methyltransferase [Gemmatimonadota bacterium]MBT5057052.1 methyltransferase [Gemmatimonadota bacterium]MBT5146825.1 methyltransferase [Gemmatimonadota bacterium]MBT5590114.1 methyltransferase [Gemmatimonadota bacterium]MBT5961691.1 methyltransferase [Gemmatimonadota bacterium]
MAPLADFTGPNYIDDWIAHLDSLWPERELIRQHLVEAIAVWQETTSLQAISLLELGVGNGKLALDILHRLQAHTTHLSYMAVDINGDLLHAALAEIHRGLPACATTALLGDLNDPAILRDQPQMDLVFSLQTLHDLHGLVALRGVYEALYQLLSPGGLLVNADFIVPFEKDDASNPRRFPVDVHHSILEELGFTEFTSQTEGKLACMTARR